MYPYCIAHVTLFKRHVPLLYLHVTILYGQIISVVHAFHMEPRFISHYQHKKEGKYFSVCPGARNAQYVTE